MDLIFWLVGLIMLAQRGGAAPAPGPKPSPVDNAADKAQAKADDANAKAAAARNAQTQQAKAASTPAPWPQAMPSGLPPFPTGWKPAQPPPAPVVTRAWQLLPTLWASGRPGARKTEQTAGNWYTYLATDMGKGKRGVTAWKPNEPITVTPGRPLQPTNNA